MNNHYKNFWILGLTLLISVITACQGINQNTIIGQTIPVDDEVISATSAIGVVFIVPMDIASVEKAFSISPEVDGSFTWEENTLWFNPAQALTPDLTYHVQIAGNLTNLEGKSTPVNLHWDFTVRETAIIFYRLSGEWGEIWRATTDGQNQRPLTESGGKVIDFAANPSGHLVVPGWLLPYARSIQASAKHSGSWNLVQDRDNL